ncbi:DUF4232 domain-containing protein [Streptomyces sp. NPDC004561]
MRTTTRLTGPLALLTAALALTACGTTTRTTPHTSHTSGASAPPCRTTSLTWSLVLLGGGADGGARPDARLTAVNKGPGACVFDGYPGVEIHNGKADSIEGAGHGHPASLALPGKAAATVDLRYTPGGTKGAGTWCVRQNEAVVSAPHDSTRTTVPVTDAHHRPTAIDACGDTIAMEPPRRTPTGS